MTAARYRVVYRGKILPGFDPQTAKLKLITTFALSEEQAERVLKSARVVLKKDLDESDARTLGSALKQAGLDVILVKSEPSSITEKPGPVPPHRQSEPALPEPQPPIPPEAGPMEPSAPPPAARPAGGAARNIPFEFRGTGSAFFKIWIVNIILSLITLGVYSAWAKVRRKRFFYGSTRLAGTGFEYLAKPMNILKGRVLIILLVVGSSTLSHLIPILGPVLSLAFVLILPWIVVRSLAFNARNSCFRNIRFGFHGSVKEAAAAYILWPALAFVTLGILFPAAYYRQKKFMVTNSFYGAARFGFQATAKDYYGLYLKALPFFLFGMAAVAASAFTFAPLAPLAGLVLYLYLFAYFSVKTANLLFNSSRLAGHRFHSDQKVWDLMVIAATNSVAIALTLGLFYPWARIRAFRYKLTHLTLVTAGELEAFIAGEEKQVSAVADEFSDFFDLDFGL